jgi:sugar transferase (PEP-CTERM/EpsH1 system associated)
MEALLFLVHRIPFPPNKGDKVRSFHILRHLATRYRVHLGALMDDPADAVHVPRLAEYTSSHCVVPMHPRWQRVLSLPALVTGAPLSLRYFHQPRLARWVATLRRQEPIRRVLVFSSPMAAYVLGREWQGARRIADLVDVDSAKFAAYGASSRGPLGWLHSREGRRLLDFERRVAATFDRTLFVSEPEAALFRRLAPESAARVGCMEMGVDTDYFDPGSASVPAAPGAAAEVVFTGAMDYTPNVDAVLWFCEAVWPRVRALRPEARLAIVGARPVPRVRALGALPGVVVTGTVPDVRPWFRAARVAVAPLRIARGVQSKVLEALAMGLPVVATPAALEGIRLAADTPCDPRSEPAEFAAAVCERLAAPISGPLAQARDFVRREYDWNRQLEVLEELLA